MDGNAAIAATAVQARSGSVQSVERALTLLETLGVGADGYRLTDLAQATGLSPSTVHRLLVTLEKRRFAQCDPSDGRWHVGRQAFSVGAAFVRQRTFAASAVPYLRHLRDQTRETANLGVVDDGMVVVLLQAEGREIARAAARVGGRLPLAGSGMGMAILAAHGHHDVAVLLEPTVGPHGVLDGRLSQDLEQTRTRGWAVDDEACRAGLRCVAAAVYNEQAEPVCAISVSGLAGRLRHGRIDALGRLVTRTARELTAALGGRLPCDLKVA